MVLKNTVEIGGGAQECFSKDLQREAAPGRRGLNMEDQQADLLEGQNAEAERG